MGGRDSLEPDGSDPLTGAAPVSDLELDATERLIDSWLEAAAGSKEAIAAVERGPQGARRWYVRVTGDEKEVWTIWFTLGQRTLHYETYLVPAPEENHAQFYEHLLRRNRRLTGLKLEIGPEDAVFLSGLHAGDAGDSGRAGRDPRVDVRRHRADLPSRDADRLRLQVPPLSGSTRQIETDNTAQDLI